MTDRHLVETDDISGESQWGPMWIDAYADEGGVVARGPHTFGLFDEDEAPFVKLTLTIEDAEDTDDMWLNVGAALTREETRELGEALVAMADEDAERLFDNA